jgi:prolyl-tRNA synthetase
MNEGRFFPKKSDDLSEWYTQVVLQAELVDYAPVRGCIVFRPYGFGIWEQVQKLLGARIVKAGHSNAYFPLFIPESLLELEKQHVQGFAPEVAWVTRGGQEDLAERLAIRPTSEAIIGKMYSKWLNSYRDLPILINQWCNIVRWEKATRPFLRTTEFLWQEGHTAHRTRAEARAEVKRMLKVYRDFVVDDLAIAVLAGPKSKSETFAGAVQTYTIEAMMPDGKALQSGTSHDLGQHFAKVFDIKFLDSDNTEKYAWQTSWGLSTRIIGAVVMGHGDDKGLILPPKVAPVQAVIVPIVFEESKAAVLAACRKLERRLSKLKAFGAPLRVATDADEAISAGFKFAKWELKGVPLRFEVGPKDLASNQVKVVERLGGGKKMLPCDFGAGAKTDAKAVVSELNFVQTGLYERSVVNLRSRVFGVKSAQEVADVALSGKGFAEGGWCGDPACEAAVKERCGATIRLLKKDASCDILSSCVVCGKPRKHVAIFALCY